MQRQIPLEMDAKYDADGLESTVDKARFLSNWPLVSKSIETYVKAFDVGSSTSSRNHEMPQLVKAYYWSVLGEVMWVDKRDYLRGIECCQKSIAAEAEYHDGKIILSRILLEGCKPFLQRIENIDPKGDAIGVFQLSSHTASSSPSATTNPAEPSTDLEASAVLSDAFNSTLQPPWSIIQSEQRVLLSIIAAAPSTYRNILLATLHALAIADQLLTCNQVLGVWRSIPSKRPSVDVLFATWILCTSRLLLSGVRLDAIISKWEAQLITEYRLWMHTDAIATRCLLNELLGDHAKSRNDSALLFRSITSAYGCVPLCCQSTGINAGSRLLSLEVASEMIQAALGSFGRSISAHPALRLPDAVLSGHKVQIAILLLNRARRSLARNVSELDFTGTADVTKAFNLLTDVRQYTLCSPSLPSANPNPNPSQYTLCSPSLPSAATDSVTPHPRSQTLCLPLTPSDPRNVVGLCNGCTVGVLLAGILLSRETTEANSEHIAALLEWGASREASATADLAWYLAKALLDAHSGRIDDATNLLSQSHRMLLDEMRYRAILDKASPVRSCADLEVRRRSEEVSAILGWLQFYPAPSLSRPWLPSGLIVDLLLQRKPLKALEQCRQAMLDLYEAAPVLLQCIGSNDAMRPHPGAFFNPNEPSYDVSARCRNESDLLSCAAPVRSAAPTLSLGEPSNKGLDGTLYRLGLCHAAMGRQAGTPDIEKRAQLMVALRCLCYLLDQGPRDDGQIDLAAVTLQRAVIVAELGELSVALREVRVALGDSSASSSSSSSSSSSLSSSSSSPQLLHLLSMLLSCTGDDDPQALAAAAVLCRRALDTTSPNTLAHVNVKITLAMLDWGAGDGDSALLAASQVMHFFRTTEKQRRDADEDMRRRDGEEELERRLLEEAASEGERKGILVGLECGCLPWQASMAEHMGEAKGERRGKKEVAPSNKYVGKHYGVGMTRITLEYKRKSVDFLLAAGRIFRSARDFQSAFYCLEDAWRILYTPSDCATMSMLGEGALLEHHRREMLRSMPTLLGWKLPECAGWGAEVLPECEALVLVEAGLLVLARSPDRAADADELYHMALAVCPSCCPALLAVAEMELTWGTEPSKALGAGGAEGGDEDELNKSGAMSSAKAEANLENPFLAIIAAKEAGLADVSKQGVSESIRVTLGESGHNSRGYEYALRALGLQELSPRAW